MRIIVRKPTPQMARALLLAVLVAGVAVLIGCPDAQRGGVSTADAGSEAPQADARPRHVFCATLMPAAQRCADFEEGELLAGWDSAGRTPNPGEQGGGILEELLEPDGRKVLARTPAIVTAGQRMAAVLLYTFPSQTPRLSVVAKLNVVTEDIPGEEQLAVMSIVFGDEGAVVVARDRQGATIKWFPTAKEHAFPRGQQAPLTTSELPLRPGAPVSPWGPSTAHSVPSSSSPLTSPRLLTCASRSGRRLRRRWAPPKSASTTLRSAGATSTECRKFVRGSG